MKHLMRRLRLNEAERGRQSPFSLGASLGSPLIVGLVLLCASLWHYGPDRTPLPARAGTIHFQPVAVDAARVAPLRLAGAWRMTADDARFGGLSALAIDDGQLLALADTGVLARFAMPSAGSSDTRVDIAELPAGPGSPLVKKDRDSEALVADPYGRGWWVAFEWHNQLWTYDRAFAHGQRAVDFGERHWPHNLGIEAMLVDRGRLTLLPERGNEVVVASEGRAVSAALDDGGSRISDMARLPTGETVVLMRDIGLTGFRNQLGLLKNSVTGWQVVQRIGIDVGATANLEGLAVQQRASGGVRLWLVTDDNFQPPQTTVLIALDLPPGGWPPGSWPRGGWPHR